RGDERRVLFSIRVARLWLRRSFAASHPRAMDRLRRLSAAERFARARELRDNPTPAERHAWTLLRNRGILGLKFRRQHVLHGFIVDFYCPSERIVIELEGNVHDTEAQRGYDQARTGFLQGAGYRVIRVRNRDASREHLEAALREARAHTIDMYRCRAYVRMW